MNLFTAFKDAWKNRDQLGDHKQSRGLSEFLPAALEIQETPPNPIARWLGFSLLALVLIAIIWAYVGKVNIVASAEGKIIPSSRVKKIQPLEKSVVKKILVSEGQLVSKGEALVELDGTLTLADKTRLEGDLYSARFTLAVNQSLLTLLNTPTEKQNDININNITLPSIATATDKDILLHKQLLWQQWQQYKAQLKSLQSTLLKNKAEKGAAREVIVKLKQTLPIITQRTKKVKSLLSKRFVSETEYFTLEQERIQQKQDLAAERQRFKQLDAAAEEVKQQIQALTAQTKAERLSTIAETQRQLAVLEEELAKATDLNAKQILYSPVSGHVQELAINTVGGVVTAAQQLMLIVPDEENLEIEVFLENKDIGFVHKNMNAEIKIHTFPFTKYGVIDGSVTTISDDAIVDEKRGLIYGMRLKLAKNTLFVDGKYIKLSPGMSVTAEMQTGHRRIIEFFMAPLLRYKSEGLRER